MRICAAVDLCSAIGDLAAGNRFTAGMMMGITKAAVLIALAALAPWTISQAGAQNVSQGVRTANASQSVTDISAQRHLRRPPTRLRVQPYYEPDFEGVYPRYYPGRNAVRECNATYVQEYRPSGTVIVPRMSCFWRPG